MIKLTRVSLFVYFHDIRTLFFASLSEEWSLQFDESEDAGTQTSYCNHTLKTVVIYPAIRWRPAVDVLVIFVGELCRAASGHNHVLPWLVEMHKKAKLAESLGMPDFACCIHQEIEAVRSAYTRKLRRAQGNGEDLLSVSDIAKQLEAPDNRVRGVIARYFKDQKEVLPGYSRNWGVPVSLLPRIQEKLTAISERHNTCAEND